MLDFVNDYAEGAHDKILDRLRETNLESTPGYGNDSFCESARQKIRKACGCEGADVYFLVGGTQSNQVVIDSVLRDYEGVIAAETGHIAVHEAGAIESTGHKVLGLPHEEGRLQPDVVRGYIKDFYADANHDHMMFPGMVYISHPTEYGTLYTKQGLEGLSAVCREYGIPLYLDGARLGYGLACADTDVSLEDIAEYCDVFYIGGTKVGALCGEAVVFTKENTPRQFLTLMKQHGALLAKGRLLGLQFDVLFTDGLYLEIGEHALKMAALLKKAFAEKGYRFYIESPTNQIFIVLDNRQMEELGKKVNFSFWERLDDEHTVARFVTSWATQESAVRGLISIL